MADPLPRGLGSAEHQLVLAVVNIAELWRRYLDGAVITTVADHSPNTVTAETKIVAVEQQEHGPAQQTLKDTALTAEGQTAQIEPHKLYYKSGALLVKCSMECPGSGFTI